METKEQFLENVLIDSRTWCWEWIGNIHKSTGYARLRWRGKDTHGHRISHELFKGPIPAGLQIDHLCRNRKCVNPDHLEAVTRKENILRGMWGAGINSRKTHCIHGHEFTPDNTRSVPNGRACVACSAIRSRHLWRVKNKVGYTKDTPVDWSLPKRCKRTGVTG